MPKSVTDPTGVIDALLAPDVPRLLIEADLRPVQGHRFQPTGFPDLGAATYTLADGTEMILVESPQSVANRLEHVCWNDATQDVVPELQGIPYVRVWRGDTYLTSSLQEFHRLNSPYILDADNHAFVHQFVRALVPDNRALAEVLKIKDDSLLAKLKEYFAGPGVGPVDERALARTVFRFDPNCVLHGLFLARDYLVGGRLRLTRLLSGFIEASDVRPAENGGVKFDRINPSGDTKLGFGHVPFHRTEYTARQITAYFNLDLATLRAYGLGRDAERLLVALALWKISRFLRAGLRLRTACDLECGNVRISRQTDFASPADLALDEVLPTLIAACGGLFAQPPVTEIHWEPPAKAKTAKAATEAGAENVDDGDEDDGP